MALNGVLPRDQDGAPLVGGVSNDGNRSVIAAGFLPDPSNPGQGFLQVWFMNPALNFSNGGSNSVPAIAEVAQYSLNPPVFNNGGVGYLQVDQSGRLLLAPTNTVGVTSLPVLPAGTNVIGGVFLSQALPAGTAHLGTVALDAPLPAGTNTLGNVGLAAPLPAGTSTIGNALVAQYQQNPLALPAGSFTPILVDNLGRMQVAAIAGSLPAGTNVLGGMFLSQPLPAGPNAIGTVALNASLPAGSNLIGNALVGQYVQTGEALVSGAYTALMVDNGGRLVLAPSNSINVHLDQPLPAGTNTLGGVTLQSPVPAGANAIGTVAINAALPAGNNMLGGVFLSQPLPAGNNAIGTVALNAPLPAGTNLLGSTLTAQYLANPAALADGARTAPLVDASSRLVLAPGTSINVHLDQPLPSGANFIGTVNAQPLYTAPTFTLKAAGNVNTNGPAAGVNVGTVSELAIVIAISAIFRSITPVIEFSPDGGTTWAQHPDGASLGPLNAVGNYALKLSMFGNLIRLNWTLSAGGTCNFLALGIGKNT